MYEFLKGLLKLISCVFFIKMLQLLLTIKSDTNSTCIFWFGFNQHHSEVDKWGSTPEQGVKFPQLMRLTCSEDRCANDYSESYDFR